MAGGGDLQLAVYYWTVEKEKVGPDEICFEYRVIARRWWRGAVCFFLLRDDIVSCDLPGWESSWTRLALLIGSCQLGLWDVPFFAPHPTLMWNGDDVQAIWIVEVAGRTLGCGG